MHSTRTARVQHAQHAQRGGRAGTLRACQRRIATRWGTTSTSRCLTSCSTATSGPRRACPSLSRRSNRLPAPCSMQHSLSMAPARVSRSGLASGSPPEPGHSEGRHSGGGISSCAEAQGVLCAVATVSSSHCHSMDSARGTARGLEIGTRGRAAHGTCVSTETCVSTRTCVSTGRTGRHKCALLQRIAASRALPPAAWRWLGSACAGCTGWHSQVTPACMHTMSSSCSRRTVSVGQRCVSRKRDRPAQPGRPPSPALWDCQSRAPNRVM